MATELSPQNERFIEQQIADGVFHNRAEALDASVELLKQRNQLVDRLKESRRQLDEGEFTEYDRPALRQLFETLKERPAMFARGER